MRQRKSIGIAGGCTTARLLDEAELHVEQSLWRSKVEERRERLEPKLD